MQSACERNLWKTLRIFLVLLCCIFPLVGYRILDRLSASAAGPVVLCTESEVLVSADQDAGSLSMYPVQIKNVSARDVRVVGAQSSCSCVIPGNCFPFKIMSGERRSVPFEVRVSERSVPGQLLANVDFLFETAENATSARVVFRLLEK